MSTSSMPVTELAEPEREVARLFPARGAWSEDEYLDLPTNRQVEFCRGRLEVLAMPTLSHQKLVRFLFQALWSFTQLDALGEVIFAAFAIRLWRGKFREPDVMFMSTANAHRCHERFWDGADLVMEVVSPDPKHWKRDLVTKRREYARAGIPESWVVDPQEQRVLVLTLAGQVYEVHGSFGPGASATSVLLPGFQVSVDALFAAAGTP